jgi:hypothetical protein
MAVKKVYTKKGPFILEGKSVDLRDSTYPPSAEDREAISEILFGRPPRTLVESIKNTANQLGVNDTWTDEMLSLIDNNGSVTNMEKFDLLHEKAKVEFVCAGSDKLEEHTKPLAELGEKFKSPPKRGEGRLKRILRSVLDECGYDASFSAVWYSLEYHEDIQEVEDDKQVWLLGREKPIQRKSVENALSEIKNK